MEKKKKRIHKGEKALIKRGVYVTYPINLSILLTPNEILVLNVIRHCKNLGERYISNSILRVNTGLSETTVRKVRDTLIELGIIQQIGEPTNLGIEYNVIYNVLCPIIEQLNEQKNPIKRLDIADKFRGVGKARHSTLIKDFKNSEFNNKFK